MSSPEAAPTARRRRWPRLLVLAVVVVVAAVVLAARLGRGDAAGQSALVGHAAPALAGTTLDGGSFDLSRWRGQVVLVNLWASWCAPCQQEMPLLAGAHSALAPRGLQIVGVDVRDGPTTARAFLQKYPSVTWPSVSDPDGERAVDWGAYGLPESYLVDAHGTVVAKATGVLDANWIDRHVVPLLRRSP